MNGINLSAWALRHQSFVVYLMLLTLALGVLGYSQLGQSEDPPFTFKVMVIQVAWPGATAREIEQQVVDRIEKAVLETAHVDVVRSFSRADRASITVIADDSAPSAAMAGMFYDIRKRVGDLRHTLPQGVQGPYFNDEFGETYGNLFALTGDGFSFAELRDTADQIRKELLRLPDVSKVLLVGEQEERVYIEFDQAKLARLGIPLAQIEQALAGQNAVVPVGTFDTADHRFFVRPQSALTDLDTLRALPLQVGPLTLRLDEVARVRRGEAEPASAHFRYQGQPALGLGVSMRAGGDIIALGRSLEETLKRVEAQLPLGMALHRVNDQPRAVTASINEFLKVLGEAVIIVLAISFLSLGLRAGLVVTLSIPLVLAGTFFVMHLFGVGLHKISLGSLILALGLLVDDAIIAIEMMAVKMQQGMERVQAAAYAFNTTALPMLTGTLITAAGFLPIAMAQSSVGEYTRSIFQVVTIALVLSWFAAVIVIPYLGYRLLGSRPGAAHSHAKRHTLAERGFRGLIEACVRVPLVVIAATLAAFVGSLMLFSQVQQQFFPDATRLELIVDLKLPEGSSLSATLAEAERLEQFLATQTDHVEHFAAYVGDGSPRFYLPLDQQLPDASFTQFVITTRSIADREALRLKLIERLDRSGEFSAVRGRVIRLENGPPVGYPVQFRISGDDLDQLRDLANQVAAVMRADPDLVNVNLDWNERVRVIRLQLDTAAALRLGITRADIARTLQLGLDGLPVGEFRERDQTIPILMRGSADEHNRLERLASLPVPTASGETVPLSQLARIDAALEEGVIWHRNRIPTITVRGDLYGDIQAPTVSMRLEAELAPLRAALPSGYRLETGGAIEESGKGNQSIAVSFPVFIVAMLTLLMIQLQSLQRTVMVLLTAPFGIIGVALFLWLFQQPFGFVALLGTIALSGMIMRNSVILIDQIERNIREGLSPRSAVIEAAVRRFRPIMLTAMTAILAMIPLTQSVFFGPMAVAIMGGLFVATVLTLLFLPALYALWFRLSQGRSAFDGQVVI